MQKDAGYHTAAIMYNEELADFAEELSERVGNEEVARWCRAIAKQHRFHCAQHKRALEKVERRAKEQAEVVASDEEETVPESVEN